MTTGTPSLREPEIELHAVDAEVECVSESRERIFGTQAGAAAMREDQRTGTRARQPEPGMLGRGHAAGAQGSQTTTTSD